MRDEACSLILRLFEGYVALQNATRPSRTCTRRTVTAVQSQWTCFAGKVAWRAVSVNITQR